MARPLPTWTAPCTSPGRATTAGAAFVWFNSISTTGGSTATWAPQQSIPLSSTLVSPALASLAGSPVFYVAWTNASSGAIDVAAGSGSTVGSFSAVPGPDTVLSPALVVTSNGPYLMWTDARHRRHRFQPLHGARVEPGGVRPLGPGILRPRIDGDGRKLLSGLAGIRNHDAVVRRPGLTPPPLAPWSPPPARP